MMYNYGRKPPLDRVRDFFKKPAVLPRLILINVAIFVLVYVTNLFFWLFQYQTANGLSFITNLLAVPASISSLLLKPWTPFTYMFLHEGFLHLLFNMIILFFGASIFLQYLNERKLLATYIFGGLTGALFYIAAYNIFPVFTSSELPSIALGASASVLAILIAAAVYVPQYVVNLVLIGPIRMKYIAIIIIVIDFFSIQGSNPGGHIAHLGGAFYGFLFAWTLRGKISLPSIKLPSFLKKKPTSTQRKAGNYSERPLSDDEYNSRKATQQQEIDHILDKVSKSGYDSLSPREKKILFSKSSKP